MIFIISCNETVFQEEEIDPEETPTPGEMIPTDLLSPSDFTYLGAFRLPDGT